MKNLLRNTVLSILSLAAFLLIATSNVDARTHMTTASSTTSTPFFFNPVFGTPSSTIPFSSKGFFASSTPSFKAKPIIPKEKQVKPQPYMYFVPKVRFQKSTTTESFRITVPTRRDVLGF